MVHISEPSAAKSVVGARGVHRSNNIGTPELHVQSTRTHPEEAVRADSRHTSPETQPEAQDAADTHTD